MVRHRQSRGRKRSRARPFSTDFETPARCPHPLRTGLHVAQVPRHGTHRHGRARRLPPDHRRGRRRDAARGGERAVHPAGGVSRRGARGRGGRGHGQRLGPHVRHLEPLSGRREGHQRGVFLPAGRRGGLLRGGALPPEPLHGQRRRGGVRRACRAQALAPEKEGSPEPLALYVVSGEEFLPLQVHGRQSLGRRPAGLQQPAAVGRHRHLQVQRR